jgi:mannose-6-phosphate isomerase-like protein (cupin superfamily)
MQQEGQILNLNELPLEEVAAHEGQGKILFNRVFHEESFRGPWNFVDYAVLPPGSSIGLHTHGENEELYLILEGEGTMTLDSDEFPVRPGHVILNRPHGTHGLQNTGSVPLKLFVVEVRI